MGHGQRAILALADGRGLFWFGLAFVISAVYTASALAHVLGRTERRLPNEPTTTTRAGRIGLLCLSATLTLATLVGILIER